MNGMLRGDAGAAIVGRRFPTIAANSLAGDMVTLPDAAKGLVALVAVAFVRRAQEQIDSWTDRFTAAFGDNPRCTVYEVPMMDGLMARVFSGSIDAGMRGGIPPAQHSHVITYYGDLDPYLRDLGIDDRNLAFVYLLDREGIIRWSGRGFATPERLEDMVEVARALLVPG
ncbi:hypothetical protein FGU65_03010 [Methanoculleus sp. FWC-SCC1]|uniref:ATP10 protein n=1 Tax=Methanoculleus frigidifontis TaxID=2584085 RepID=A0ABT8M7G6_9EURY|nr:hypothetical protein [Methanoculleus sp. FWC-SCC1]MDN7023870.1 hypothetical protein [Methanoculleus sp. FWC-SCC1]